MLAVGIFEDVRPLRGPAEEIDWIHQGVLSRLILDGKITGKLGESILLATQQKIPASKVLVIGLGVRDRFDYSVLQKSLEIALNKLLQLKVKRCVTELFGIVQCRLDITQVVQILTLFMIKSPVWKEIDLSLLVPNADKAHQVEQHLSAISVTV